MDLEKTQNSLKRLTQIQLNFGGVYLFFGFFFGKLKSLRYEENVIKRTFAWFSYSRFFSRKWFVFSESPEERKQNLNATQTH